MRTQHHNSMHLQTLKAFIWSAILAFPLAGQAQIMLDGYVFEANNRGFLNQAKVRILELPDNILRLELLTDMEGHFAALVAPGRYRVQTQKDLFFERNDTIVVGTEKTYLKAEMQRKPGYIFDATLAEARMTPDQIVNAITGARIEVYNRTQRKAELVIVDNPNAFFQHTFEQGNHYTMLIRKPGYISKRIEAFVNIEGCILCIDGIKDLNPGVTDNLTAGNKMGTLLSNIELEPVRLDKRIAIQNIYYDYDKSYIRADAAKQLDKVITLMRDNPGLSLELGSHTDSRGRDTYNDTLSQRRAEAAVKYIIEKGNFSTDRMSAHGYGETQLINRCKNGVQCSENEHQLNRRTELRITKIDNPELEKARWRTLEEVVREEEFDKQLQSLDGSQVVKIEEPAPASKKLPEANNSVPLPKIETTTTATTSTTTASTSAATTLPSQYTGFLSEVLQSPTALTADASIFKQYNKVFTSVDAQGRYTYYVGDYSSKEAAVKFFDIAVKTKYPSARVAQFNKGVKTYVN
jgi:outer membrane protein OmpA-like peptidoglycan-associated protein